MDTWKLALLLAVSATAAFGFTCPEDSHTFYHADVSTGCQVYHLCENSQLQTLTCPTGKAFNYETSKCEEATTVECRETTGDHANHHHKRAAIEQQVNTINIQPSKLQEEFCQMIKPILEEAYGDTSPSIYNEPAFKPDVLPFLGEHAHPECQKLEKYLLRMIAPPKAYKSYELSNSTHIAFVTLSDLADIVQSRYLYNLLKNKDIHIRKKRESPPIPDFILSLITPYVNNMLSSITGTLFGNFNSFTSKVIMPTVYDMFGNEESRYYMLGLWLSAKSAYSPFLWEMMKKQSYDTPEGTIIHIPRHLFDEANEKFRNESKPFLYKLAEKHLPSLLKLASEHVPALLDDFRQIDKVQYEHSGVLKDAIMHFVIKHAAVFQDSTSSHISTYTLTEIMNDLRPIKIHLLKVLVEYIKSNKDSYWNILFGPDSIITKSLMSPDVYAQPQNTPKKPQKVKDLKGWDNY